MNDKFDVSLVDTVLLAELELTIDLIVAASQSDRHLTQNEIDALLGIPPAAPDPPHIRRSPTGPIPVPRPPSPES